MKEGLEQITDYFGTGSPEDKLGWNLFIIYLFIIFIYLLYYLFIMDYRSVLWGPNLSRVQGKVTLI